MQFNHSVFKFKNNVAFNTIFNIQIGIMLFNSLDFAIFLPIVFILYWLIPSKNLKTQNVLIVVASYLFYGWWDWRFLSLILVSTLVDFYVGGLL